MATDINKIQRLSIAAIILLTEAFAWTQVAATNTPTPESWRQSTQDISEADATGKKDIVRQERSAAFNDKKSDAEKLDSPGARKDLTHGSFPPYFVRTPAMPVQESNTVIVATVTSVQPYFSNDHAHLYTEFVLAVDEQIKDISGRAKAGGTIPVVIRGGKMRLVDGRIVEEKVAFANFAIAAGVRYLFFLRYNNVGQFFTVVKSWELKDGGVIPIAHEDQMDAREGKSRYSSMTDKAFIQVAYSAAKLGNGQVDGGRHDNDNR